MARQNNTATATRKVLFGTPDAPKTPQYGTTLAEQVSERLAEKHRNYERAATRLELRGEHDAADVLHKAAARLRLIRNAGEPGDEDSAL